MQDAADESRALRARAGRPTVDRDVLLALVRDNYPAVARELLGPLLEFLSLSREACGGDGDKFLIMLVVGIRTTEHETFASFTQAELLSGDIPVFPSLGTNIRSVADSIGAPRETVRRKVGELVGTGWIARQGNELRFTSHAYQQLAHVRIAIERLAVRNYETVEHLLRRSPPLGARA
jgi:CRP-like cAMP-binding protein